MERETNPESTTFNDAYLFLEARVGDWNFSEHDDLENNHFVYCASLWASEISDNYMQFRSEEFAGDELPASLLPLVRQEWRDEQFFSGENTVKIERKPDYEYIPPVIPGYDTLRDLYDTYEDIINRISSDPQIYENVQKPQLLVYESMHISFEPARYNDWGLQFNVQPRQLLVAPFGKAGHTWKPTEYLMTYNDKPQVLSATAAELVVLAAKHFTHRDYTVGLDAFSRFDRYLAHEEVADPTTLLSDFISPGGIKELIVKDLIKQGKLTDKS